MIELNRYDELIERSNDAYSTQWTPIDEMKHKTETLTLSRGQFWAMVVNAIAAMLAVGVACWALIVQIDISNSIENSYQLQKETKPTVIVYKIPAPSMAEQLTPILSERL